MHRSVPDPFLDRNINFIPDVRNNKKRNNDQNRLNTLTYHARLLLHHFCSLCFHCVRAVVKLFGGQFVSCQGVRVLCGKFICVPTRGSQFQIAGAANCAAIRSTSTATLNCGVTLQELQLAAADCDLDRPRAVSWRNGSNFKSAGSEIRRCASDCGLCSLNLELSISDDEIHDLAWNCAITVIKLRSSLNEPDLDFLIGSRAIIIQH